MRKLSLVMLGLVSIACTARAGASTQEPITYTKSVCHFYGQTNHSPAWNKDESCTIPDASLLDTQFHQNDFICCGGGANASTTSADIPAGLEIKVTGGYYWSVFNPKLSGSSFTVHTYCGPGGNGEGCNVGAEVIAHYRVIQSPPAPQTSPSQASQNSGAAPAKSDQANLGVNQGGGSLVDKLGIDKLLAFVFGVPFLLILLAVAVFVKNPTPLAILIFRVTLALAAAGIGAVIPGMIDVNVNPVVRAGGAIALFVIVFWFNPPALIANTQTPSQP